MSAESPSGLLRQWSRRDWARYQAFKRRLAMARQRWRDMYEQHGDLYGHGWEIAETSFIREECEQIGLPMGYGRVGRTPEQITWGTTEPMGRVDWGDPEEVECEDEEPERVHHVSAGEPREARRTPGRSRKMGPRRIR